MDRNGVYHVLRRCQLLKHTTNKLRQQAGLLLERNLVDQSETLREEALRLDCAALPLVLKSWSLLVPLAQRECPYLCEMIQGKLPRELRDMIFRFTLPPSTVVVEKSFPIYGSTPTRSINWLKTVLPANCQHLCDRSYIDAVNMLEMAGIWYSVTTFRLMSRKVYSYNNEERHTILAGFLHHDQWGSRLDVTRLIKKVELYLDYASVINRTEACLLTPLQAMVQLRPKAQIVLEFYSARLHSFRGAGIKQYPQSYIEALSSAFPVLERLVLAGIRVFVDVENLHRFEVQIDGLTLDHWRQEFNRVLI